MSEHAKNLERWMAATASAMRSLTAYFPVREVLTSSEPEHRGRLSPRLFPCQKADEKRCQGWVFARPESGLGAQRTTSCPCAQGQSTVLMPLLELAAEFAEEFDVPVARRNAALSSYTHAAHRAEFLLHILSWMHWAAKVHVPARQEAHWIDQFVDLPLESVQRHSLRWWIRLLELNQLINNNSFTLLTRRGLQGLHQQGQSMAIAEGIERLGVTENALLVLCLNGDPLKVAGQHSQVLAWFESFISCVDDFRLGLCLIAPQPLLEAPASEVLSSRSPTPEYRWKMRRQVSDRLPSMERVLRRGSWDRLIEALARGDRLLSVMGISSL